MAKATAGKATAALKVVALKVVVTMAKASSAKASVREEDKVESAAAGGGATWLMATGAAKMNGRAASRM